MSIHINYQKWDSAYNSRLLLHFGIVSDCVQKEGEEKTLTVNETPTFHLQKVGLQEDLDHNVHSYCFVNVVLVEAHAVKAMAFAVLISLVEEAVDLLQKNLDEQAVVELVLVMMADSLWYFWLNVGGLRTRQSCKEHL
jgi:hypothetical protein